MVSSGDLHGLKARLFFLPSSLYPSCPRKRASTDIAKSEYIDAPQDLWTLRARFMHVV